jgi:hypothetical protein
MNRETISSFDAVRLALALALGTWAGVLSGCTPKIGDKCVLNTDCGSSGTLSCDTSTPGGYCTQFNCQANKCQNNAACVEFLASVPGCPYDDYQSPSRTGRSFCLKTCQKDSDCRQSEGYVCSDPKIPPWSAQIIDDSQQERVCIVKPTPVSSMAGDAGDAGFPPICMVGLGDAVAPPIDAGVVLETDGASVDGGDGGDGSNDAETDVSGEPADSASEDGAGAPDASVDGAADVGAADAPDGD